MANNYNYISIEEKWQKFWLELEVYKYDDAQPRENIFVIDTPPPTVSGMLHIGHVFSYTQTDFIARYQRMRGKTVFYPIGFDDNGLPTERLVEKVKNIRSIHMQRNEFVDICREIIPSFEKEFRKLFENIALSVDWDHAYQTISKHSQCISQMSFLDLYYKSRIVRNRAPVFWDPVDKTAIAQAEIEDKEQQGLMNEIKFEVEDGKAITIATTRPELIPACVCIFVHPDDERYKSFIGKNAITPIFSRKIHIMADVDVAQDKGTGAVMCCTFGDIQDVYWWQRYNLEIIDCITTDGKMQNAGFLNGMYVKQARAAMIEKLYSHDLLLQQHPVVQFVKCAERSGAPLEIISTEQWYIKVLDSKDAILRKASECNWYPPHMKVRFDNWVNGLNQDWCISRQRHFGIPFPVWYSKRQGEEGEIIVARREQLPVDPAIDLPYGYERHEVAAELDVMDTWATSALTPQISSCGISEEYASDIDKHRKLFPFDLRPQAHEIIRIWAFGTIVKALYHENTIPWKNLMISGWCLAHDKSKMSKSKGNVVEPIKLISERGADAVRYWASTSKLGNDIIFSEDAFKIGKKLILKLMNAAEFCKKHFANLSVDIATPKQHVVDGVICEALDIWVLLELYNTILTVQDALDEFEYCSARSAVENFFWNIFCDNYLELVKDRLYKQYNNSAGQSGIVTIYYVLDALLRLFAPFLPYITEEIYQNTIVAFKQEKNHQSIHTVGGWPDIMLFPCIHHSQKASVDIRLYAAFDDGKLVLEVLELVRKYKSTNSLSIGAEVDLIMIRMKTSAENFSISESALHDLKAAARSKNITIEIVDTDTATTIVDVIVT